jgi:hypothetical protein
MTIENLVRNAFLDNPGDDWVAIAANGHPVGRASDEASLRRANPDAAHFVRAKDLAEAAVEPATPEPNPVAAGLDAVTAQGAAPAPVADGSAFDGDGDGKVGGSKPRAKKTAAK